MNSNHHLKTQVVKKNAMSCKQKIILMEDTESMNVPGKVLTRYISTNLEGLDVKTIYWKSPCFGNPGEMDKWLSESPQYIIDGVQTASADFILPIVNTLRIQHISILQDAVSNTSNLLDNVRSLKPRNIARLRFNSVHIGIHAISAIARFYPQSLLQQEISAEHAEWAIRQQLLALSVFNLLLELYSPLALFLSETTYLAGGLSEYAAYKGCNAFQFAKEGFVNNREALRVYGELYNPKSAMGYSYMRRYNAYASLILPDEIKSMAKDLMLERISDVTKIYNTSSRAAEMAKDFCISISVQFDPPIRVIEQTFGDSINSQNLKPIKIVIFYLHCILDGLYSFGYDLYSTPYDYFIDVAKFLAQISSDCVLIFKPHPNMCGGIDSDSQNSQNMAAHELHTSKNLLIQLIEKCRELGFSDVRLCDPLLGLGKLANLSDCLHVTQFGTCAIELLYKNANTLYSNMAPNAGLTVVGGYVWQEVLHYDAVKISKLFDKIISNNEEVLLPYIVANFLSISSYSCIVSLHSEMSDLTKLEGEEINDFSCRNEKEFFALIHKSITIMAAVRSLCNPVIATILSGY